MKKSIKVSIIALLLTAIFVLSSVVTTFANDDGLRIVTQPTNGYANVGKTASTTVVAAGEGLQYTWFVKDVNSDVYVKSAIKANKYLFTMTTEKSGRLVYCVVTDQYGNSVTTDTVSLSIPSEIDIVKQPENVSVPLGAMAKTTFEAMGEGLKYQWYVKDVTDTEFKKSALVSNTYIYTMTESGIGRQAYCVITDKYGNKSTTDTITFSLLDVEITKQPEDVYVPLGGKAQTKVEASGEGLRYQWYVKETTDIEFKKSSLTSNVYVYTMTEKGSGRQAYCVISDKYKNTVTTDTVTFYLSDLAITEQPKNIGVLNGEIAEVRFNVKGDGLTYQWFVKDVGDNEFFASEVTESVYAVRMSEEISGRQVYCEVTDNVGNVICTKTVVLAISQGITITKQPSNTHAIIGAMAKTTVEATGEGLKYQWYVKDTTDENFKKSSLTSNTYVFKMTEHAIGRQVYCVITDKYGNTAKSETITFRKTTLKITKQPYHTSGTIGKLIKTTVVAEGEGLTYTWYVKKPGSDTYSKSSIKANYYAYTLTEANSGCQVYCIITDKYGDTVQSTVAVMGTNAGLKILKEPTDVKGSTGMTLSAVIEAEGIGLKYQWYVKTINSPDFVKSSFTTNTYTYRTDEHKADRQLYCVITDSSGNSITTKTIMFSIAPALKITQQPTNIGGAVGTKVSTIVKAEGVGLKYKWYIKNKGEENFTLSSDTSGTYKAIVSEQNNGSQVYCVITDMFGVTKKTETITVAIYKNYITADLGASKTQKFGVGENGSYALKTPVREGFTFKGWVDENGNTFTGKETVDSNIKIKAVWEIHNTDTLDELIDLTSKGADTIKITGNITVDKPIYISFNTKIYADGNYTIKRAPGYAGDIFVVGRDYDEISAIMKHRKAILTLGGGKGTLTIDGNRDNVTVDVVGSAVFVGDSATLNLYDGIVIKNNKKVGNERIFAYTDYCSVSTLEKFGGAAIINMDSTLNIYGGIIENNEVAMEYTQITTEEGVVQSKESNGCGGAIFNRGTMTMCGGVIRDNDALRGGAIYNDRIIYLRAGTIEGNNTTTYGGAISSSSSANADLFIGTENGEGTVTIKNNTSGRAGGALYSSIQSPIMIYGKTLFEGNRTDTSSGAAIYTAGSLIIKDATFRGNETVYSGGAIYFHYPNLQYSERQLVIEDCVFEGNQGSLGGAIVISASNEVVEQKLGAKVNIKNTIFKNNVSVKNHGNVGNGGAIYATRCANLSVADCTFEGNVAHTSGGGISIHSGANVTIINTNYKNNQATSGGAMYVSTGVSVKLDNILFESNKAVHNANGGGGNGGALYTILTNPTMSNITFKNNTAQTNGGAFYQNASDLVMGSDFVFEGNTALGHGGAIYMTYQRLAENAIDGSNLVADGVTFKNNTAAAGGAVSVRTSCKVVLNNLHLENNTATGVKNDASGGGAVYVGYGEAVLNNVTATGNSSAGYGGVICAVSAPVTINDCYIEGNFSPAGGVVNAIINSDVTITNTTLKNNESTYDNVDYNANMAGGAVNITSGSLTISASELDGNKSDYYGGAIATNNTFVNINNNTVIKNSSGGTGAALYFRGKNLVTLEDIKITDNKSTANGVIYAGGGTVTVKRVIASGNRGANGGVFFTSGNTVLDVVNSSFTTNSANQGGVVYQTGSSVVNLRSNTFTYNSAKHGGALYNVAATLNLNTNIFTANTATSNGGVIFNQGGNITAIENNAFENNSAVGHGGAIYNSYYTYEDSEQREYGIINMNYGRFTGNTALAGGAVSIRTGCEATFNGTSFTSNSVEGFVDDNDGDGEGGGVIYVGYGTVNLNNAIVTDNTADLGGAVDAFVATVNITGGKYIGNTASSGGVIYATGSSNVNVSSAKFENNSSTDKTVDGVVGGGAININKGTLNVSGATFDGNTTGYYGGVINARGTTVVINENSVIKNSSGQTGAALYFRDGAKVTLTDMSLVDNTAKSNGVIYANGGSLTATNLTANGNKAYNGGVLYVSGSTTVNVSDSALDNNTATAGGMLYVVNTKNLTLEGNTINGNSATTGGAIYASTNAVASLKENTISENSATNGGAIYVSEGATANLEGNIITANTAKHGGAMYAVRSTVNLAGDNFANNSATSNGGAIYINGATVTATGDNLFENNSAAGHGGAIYDSYYTDEEETKHYGVLNMQGGTFNGNTALAGGAVSIRTGCEATFDGTVFTANSVEGYVDENDGDGEGGGVIYVGFGTVNLNNVTATDNTAGLGGVVDVYVGTVNITGGTYSGNTASSGGVIYSSGNSTVTINGAEFKNNESTDATVEGQIGGGVININKGTLNVSGATFDGNKTAYYGAVINAQGTTVTINGNTVIKNNTGRTGAALYFRDGAKATIENVSIENNTAASNGVIYNNGGTLTVNNMIATGNKSYNGLFYLSGGTNTVTNSTFTSNTASYGGVALVTSGAKFNATDSTFSSNKATSGGVIYASGSAKVTINSSTLSANTGKGGSVYVTENANVTLNGGTIQGHTSNNAIWANGGTINLNGILASNNNASVVYAEGAAVVNATDSEFTNNSANHGAAIYTKGAAITLSGNTFKENTATSNGGAIYINGATVTATGDNLFENNSAAGHGGAIYDSYYTDEEETKHYGVLNMQGGTFNGNTALAGGAVSIRTGCEATFDGTVFTANSVEGYVDENDGDGEGGGVIYVGFGTVNLNNVIATGNTAELGGVIDAISGTVNITGGTYQNNSAVNGGVIYAISNSKINISGGLFENNSAVSGGAIKASSNVTITILDAELNGNSSTDKNTAYDTNVGGGAINISGGKLTITGTTLDGNSTGYYGGAVLANGTNVVIDGETVIKNSAGGTGAALYFKGGTTAKVENVIFEGNTATSNGVIYSSGGTHTFTNVTATSNKAYNGAVFFVSGGAINVTGGTFTSNTASNNGGVLSLSGSAKANITDSTLSDNKAANGGAVYTMGSAKAEINNCSFSANKGTGGSVHVTENANVTVNGGSFNNHSGANAVWTNGGTVTLNGVTANSNTTSVIYAKETAVVNLNDSEFVGNTSTHGAVLYIYTATANLSGNTFKENSVTGNGAVIYMGGATVNGTGDSLFENNSAAGHGGAIYVSYANAEDGTKIPGVLNMQADTFNGNTALAGGAVSIRTGCEATFNGTSFTSNSVEGYNNENDGDGEGGGVIYVGYGTVTLNNVIATGNTAGLGGVVDTFVGTVNITGGTYSENKAASGGVIYAVGSSTVNIVDAEFKNNESTNTTVDGKIGGGVVNINKGSLTVTNAIFDGNKTKYYGAAINSQGATVTVNGNSVVKNNTGVTGAALYFRDSSKVTLENIIVENNTATSNGVIYNNGGTFNMNGVTVRNNNSVSGILFVSGGTNTVTNCMFTTNTAKNGGAIYASTKITIKGTTFESNTATSKGGALYGTGNGNFIISDDSEFNGNTAPTGGAIYIDQGAKANVTGGTFEANTATNGDGGAIVVADTSTGGTYATNLTINSVTFKNNTASSKGGAISTDTTSPNLIISANGCTFEGNKALGAGGGAIEIQNANCNSADAPTQVTIVFTNCIFTKNTSKTTGAAIEIRSGSCAKVDGITATENKATGVGGVIYVTSNNSRFYLTGDVEISGNTASDNSFINLYTTSSYNCPPKVYTTHSSSASWYSLVKGNKTSIQFDLVELP